MCQLSDWSQILSVEKFAMLVACLLEQEVYKVQGTLESQQTVTRGLLTSQPFEADSKFMHGKFPLFTLSLKPQLYLL